MHALRGVCCLVGGAVSVVVCVCVDGCVVAVMLLVLAL